MEGVPAGDLVRRFGTPLYVYSGNSLRDRFRRLERAFSARRPLVCYAVKANPNRAVCGLLSRAGAGADVVSGGELFRALRAGFAPGKTVFSGVGKTEPEMRLALRSRILALHVESAEEMEVLASVARRLRRPAPVTVRVNPGVLADTHEHIATGHPGAKFGVPPEEALALLKKASRSPWLRPRGLHAHVGSQIAHTAPYRASLKVLLGLAERARRSGIPLEYLDIGGGMGIEYGAEGSLAPEDLAAAVLPALRESPLRLLLEPGRWLVGPGGVLLTTVLYRKRTSARRFVVVDAGMNDLMRPAFYGARHDILPARATRKPRVEVDVVGPVCETSDFLAKGRRLPWPERGEVLAVLQAGAYGFSMSSQYNSRPRAAEVLVTGSRAALCRRRESAADLVACER